MPVPIMDWHFPFLSDILMTWYMSFNNACSEENAPFVLVFYGLNVNEFIDTIIKKEKSNAQQGI